MRAVPSLLVLGLTVVLSGCSTLDLTTKTTHLGPGLLVTNGIAFDRATLDVGGHDTIVVPDSAEVKEGAAAGHLVILMSKELAFAGHPPLAMSPWTARHYMGCAWRTEGRKLILGTYGEWDSHIEGGGRLTMTVLTPPGMAVEKRPGLSGQDSKATQQRWSPGLDALLWGYWYGSGGPADGWRRVPSWPDLRSARR